MLNILLSDLPLDSYITLILTSGVTVRGGVAESPCDSIVVMQAGDRYLDFTTVPHAQVAAVTVHNDATGARLGYFIDEGNAVKIAPL